MRLRGFRRALPALVVALLLVTAGCSLPGGGEQSPTTAPGESPSPVPTDGSPTGTAGDVAVPGVEDGRLVDAEALATAHAEALTASSFETRRVQNASVVVPTGPNSSQVARTAIVQQVVAGEGGSPYRYQQTDSATGFRLQAWGNDSVRVFRALQGDEVVRPPSVGESEPVSSLVSQRSLRAYLESGNFTVQETTTRNGTTLVTLTADELAVENDSDLFVRGSSDYEEYDATVVVSESGVVRSLELSATYDLRGERRDLAITYEVVRQGGVEFEQPEWAARALAAATPTEEPVQTSTPT
ncbi:DUF7537 family lipoprotein [Halomarina oriensis]|uniref:Uncharacterized protein n=1 Tax=Halomarina oriensis TaxID=671145 RepID=A0A6B0GNE4_9EURY|nr:hypothetical protein [Halomarina oriensis]MWG35471.1 hypothetical protein [Halomarina oriensis]